MTDFTDQIALLGLVLGGIAVGIVIILDIITRGSRR